MAGRPIYRAMVDALNRAAVEAEQESPLALAAQWIENGDTLTELAAYLSTFATRHDTGAHVTVTRSHLSRYLHETFGEEATKHLNAARKQEGAHAMAERALTDIADVQNDRDAIAKAKLQSDRRFKLAESYNREQYGQSKQQVDVNVNVGALFLDSLRKREVEPQSFRALVQDTMTPEAIERAAVRTDAMLAAPSSTTPEQE